MTKLQTFDLTPFRRNAVGFDDVVNRIFSNVDNMVATNYPPYNIIRKSDDSYIVELAIAGFSRDDITISVKEGVLTVEGNKDSVVENEYLYRGIGNRKFSRSFILADYMEVEQAEIVDGILRIECQRHIPESMKPRLIEIK